MTAFLRKLAATCGLVVMGLVAAGAQEAAAPAAPQTEDERLAAFFEEVFKRTVDDSPLYQAYLGIKGPDYGKWNDFSDEEAQRHDQLNRQDLDRLHKEFDYGKLSERMKISYRIFEVQTQSSIENFPWRFHGYAFQTQVFFLFQRMRQADVGCLSGARLDGIDAAAPASQHQVLE